MIYMKILFLGNQNIFGKINAGGLQCSKRNYELIKSIDKDCEIFAAIIWNVQENQKVDENVRYFNRVRNECEALVASLFLCKTYPVSEENKILSYIAEVKPDVLFLDTSAMGKLLKKVDSDIKKIVFFHNIESEYTKHKVREEGIKYVPSYLTSYYNEKMAVKMADKVICLNKRDGNELYNIYGRNADSYLPISFYDNFDESRLNRDVSDKRLIFIGSFFPPNYKGILWFVKNVMSRLPQYELLIIGKGFEAKRKELECDNVKVIGTVEDLAEYYYTASSIVMPIQYGDGMKVKTAEAMMYGITTFATDEALEGYEVDGIKGIYRCNSSDDFIMNIKEAYESKRIEAFNNEIRDYFLKNHETKRLESTMRDILGVSL